VVSKAKRMVDVSIALFARFASNNRIGDLLSLLSMLAYDPPHGDLGCPISLDHVLSRNPRLCREPLRPHAAKPGR
jgi:hypothetical protein